MAGRPRIGKMTSFTIRADQKAAITSLAALWGVPQSWVMRHLLDLVLPGIKANPVSPFTANPYIGDDRAAD